MTQCGWLCVGWPAGPADDMDIQVRSGAAGCAL